MNVISIAQSQDEDVQRAMQEAQIQDGHTRQEAATRPMLPQIQIPRYDYDPRQLTEKVGHLTIRTPADHQAACEALKWLKGKIQSVSDFFAPYKKALDRAHKEVCEGEKKALAPYKQADEIVRKMVQEFEEEQEKRAAALLEQNHDEAVIEEAARLEEEGQLEQAQAVLSGERPLATVLSVAPSYTPVEGIGSRTTWGDYELDLEVLVMAAAKDYGHLGKYLAGKDKLIKAEVKVQKDACKIPGVKPTPKKGLRVG